MLCNLGRFQLGICEKLGVSDSCKFLFARTLNVTASKTAAVQLGEPTGSAEKF